MTESVCKLMELAKPCIQKASQISSRNSLKKKKISICSHNNKADAEKQSKK